MYTTLIVIFCTTGPRSEALASLLLELYGLQDMLEGLCEWVAVAEATMATTEASPVGNDMEIVERQLTEHEVCSSLSLHTFCAFKIILAYVFFHIVVYCI